MFDTYMGVIQALGFNFVPAAWGYCHGAILSIDQFSTLFSLLGCEYGGDCQSTFGLPDLRGRAPMGQGTGPGLTNRHIGIRPGFYHGVFGYTQMPEHSHSHTYAADGDGGAGMVLHVATTSGDRQLPEAGSYIAPLGNNLGVLSDNRFAEAASVAESDKVAIGGVTGGGRGFMNDFFEITTTPEATEYVNLMQPGLVLNFCICMEGLYPSRS